MSPFSSDVVGYSRWTETPPSPCRGGSRGQLRHDGLSRLDRFRVVWHPEPVRAAAALVLATLVGGLIPGLAWGQSIATAKDQPFEAQTVLLPYGFYNENLKLGVGAAFVTNGWLQEQMALIATGFVTTNGSRSTFLFGRDTAVPGLDRLFLDSRLSFGYFDEFESYIDGNPLPAAPSPRARL